MSDQSEEAAAASAVELAKKYNVPVDDLLIVCAKFFNEGYDSAMQALKQLGDIWAQK